MSQTGCRCFVVGWLEQFNYMVTEMVGKAILIIYPKDGNSCLFAIRMTHSGQSAVQPGTVTQNRKVLPFTFFAIIVNIVAFSGSCIRVAVLCIRQINMSFLFVFSKINSVTDQQLPSAPKGFLWKGVPGTFGAYWKNPRPAQKTFVLMMYT